MKLTALLLMGIGLSVSAKTVSQTITFSEKNGSLEKAFRAVKQQTGYVVIFSLDVVKKAAPVSINAVDEPLESFLFKLLDKHRLSFLIRNKTISIKWKPDGGEPDQNDVFWKTLLPITGIVKDADGNPLIGATVRVKGRDASTGTDEKGGFSLNANEGDVLIISYIGFGVKEIKITGTSFLSISLVREEIKMDTAQVIVNTGYQQISKERSAGSFSKPNMQVLQDRSISMNVLQRLDGLVPGLTVNNAPNSPNPLLIRGLGTLGLPDEYGDYTTNSGTNRNPLFIVDGMQMDNVASINPQDVADITVLKDATAASIWGARASNGVIVITTRKGSTNDRIRVKYNAFMNFQGMPDLEYMPVMSSKDYIKTVEEIFAPDVNSWESVSGYPDNGTGVPPHEVILYNRERGLISQAQARKSLDSLGSINNIQQIKDLWYRPASLMNHTLSVSAGGKVYALYGSLSYTNTQSPRPGDKDNVYKINLRHDLDFGKRVHVYLITDLTNTNTSVKRNINIDSRFYPYQLFRDENGKNLSTAYMGYLSDSFRLDFQNRSRINLDYIPLDEANYGYTKTDGVLARITSGVTVKLFKGLRFEGMYGYIKQVDKTTSFDDEKSYKVRSELVQYTVAPTSSSVPVYYLPSSGGQYSIGNMNRRDYTIRNQLIYDNSWNGGLHQLVVLGGQEASDLLSSTNKSTVRGYNETLQTYADVDYLRLKTTGVSNAVMGNGYGPNYLYEGNPFTELETQRRFTSYYGSLGYTYDRKYTVNGSWRIDKSNMYGLDKSAQNRPVWSTGVKWALSQEHFLGHIPWLDMLDLRATYGITGNSPAPGVTSSYDILSARSNPNIPGGIGLSIVSAANPKLTWESTKNTNIGVDFSVLNGRLSGSMDIYSRKTQDLIGNLTVNGFSGYSYIVGNFGNLKNTGVELSINSVNIRSRSFSWSSLLNLAYNKNKVTQLNSPFAVNSGYDKVTAEYLTGYTAFSVFAYQYAGLDNMGAPQIKLADGNTTKAPTGTLPDDIVFMGAYQPVWSGGFSNFFRYKAFGLSANAVFNLGHVMRRDVSGFYYPYASLRPVHGSIGDESDNSGFLGGQIHPEFLKRWKNKGDEAFTNVPSYEANVGISETRRNTSYYDMGDINVVSASFIKLRDIALSYSLPKILINRIKADDITFSLQLSNIMVWKANNYDIDPEFQDPSWGKRLPGNALSDASASPNYRWGQGTMTIRLNVTF